ncbi:MAG TPA: response regulator [Candidatus Acidoferrales bacterium]|nr:response regulator [Candidatus Acidoferrales bacterium]
MPSILVADDNTNIQKMVSLAFEDRGITVVAVGNGEAAVRRIPDLNPDLVLADIFMPVRNGYEVCEFVKKDQRFSHVPVILLVGAFDPLDEKEARRVGADGVLKKPFVPPDPLIAMVISALEKNPRVVAELAKAKAALEPHAMPEAAASFDVQALPKPEPKPLPDFPEPTPEEAALVYGFGKGVRAIDDEEPAGASKEPPAPMGHKAQEDDEDFETGATARDWRRTAMDFEISDEDASRPAFSTVDELEPVAFFPSEAGPQKAEARAELKPERKLEPEIEARVEPRFEAEAQPEIESKSVPPIPVAREIAPVVVPSVTPVIADEVDVRALEPAEAEPVRHVPIGFARDTHIAPPVPAPVEARSVVPEKEPEPEAKPSLASRMRHWMDALVSSPAPESTHEEPKASDDWMARVSESREEAAAPVPEPQHPAVEPPQPVALAIVKTEPAEESFFADESAHATPAISEPAPYDAMASAETAETKAAPVEDEPIEIVPEVIETRAFEEAAEMDIVPVEEHGEESKPVEEAKPEPEPAPEIWEQAEETTPSLRDPYLVVPEAVRVTPEPLLIDEEPEAVSSYAEYGEHQPEAHVADAFEVSAAPEPVAEDAQAEKASLPEPSFAAASEFAAEGGGDRIPTGPPPNRDALAEIPFLNPPQGFDPNARAAQPSTVDASTVDAVVEKLLEKLQPQLHDLLSQGVLRPLVENLLRQEAAKKEE